MAKYYLDIDDLFPKLFTEFERISIGKGGHICEVEDKDANAASMQVARSLVPFLEKNMKVEDDDA